MIEIKKILVPTDLTESSLASVKYALFLARQSGAKELGNIVFEGKDVRTMKRMFWAAILLGALLLMGTMSTAQEKTSQPTVPQAHGMGSMMGMGMMAGPHSEIVAEKLMEMAEEEREDLYDNYLAHLGQYSPFL